MLLYLSTCKLADLFLHTLCKSEASVLNAKIKPKLFSRTIPVQLDEVMGFIVHNLFKQKPNIFFFPFTSVVPFVSR